VILLGIDIPAAVAGLGWRFSLNQVHSDAHLEREQPVVTHYAAVSAGDPMMRACEQTKQIPVRRLCMSGRAIAPYQILLTRQEWWE